MNKKHTFYSSLLVVFFALGIFASNQLSILAFEEEAVNQQIICGCTDYSASNFNSNANVDDGSCEYPEEEGALGCTDRSATNYDPSAVTDNGTCIYPEEQEENQVVPTPTLSPVPTPTLSLYCNTTPTATPTPTPTLSPTPIPTPTTPDTSSDNDTQDEEKVEAAATQDEVLGAATMAQAGESFAQVFNLFGISGSILVGSSFFIKKRK